MSIENVKYLRDLRRQLTQHYDSNALELVTNDLGLDWNSLYGQDKATKAQSLVRQLAEVGWLTDLVTILSEEDANISWPSIPAPQQQIEDLNELILPIDMTSYLSQMYTLLAEGSLLPKIGQVGNCMRPVR